MSGWRLMSAAAGLILTTACSGLSDTAQETLVNVVTLQRGTISELRTRRGSGPFRTYARSPDVMLEVVHRAAQKARGPDGRPVQAVFMSEERREIIAKERSLEDATDDGYAKPFRSAMIAFVHAVPGQPTHARVEVHAMERGPFHGGDVEWERDMPRWIDQALREPAHRPGRITPLR